MTSRENDLLTPPNNATSRAAFSQLEAQLRSQFSRIVQERNYGVQEIFEQRSLDGLQIKAQAYSCKIKS